MRLIGLPTYAAVAAILVQGADAQPPNLTFEQRVRAQEAIERAYYSHQIGASRPFEEAVPRAVLEKKVRTYLKESAALDTFWKTPVTSEVLRKELERMAANTRMPERLQELYTVLGNDSLLIQESLARPALVDRLAQNFFASDTTIHAGPRQEAEALREDLAQGRLDPWSDHPGRSAVELVRVAAAEGARGSGERERTPADRKDVPFRLDLQFDAFDRYGARLPARVGEIGPIQEEREAFVIRVVLDRTQDEIKVATFVVPKLSWDEWWVSVEGGLVEASVDAVAAAVDSPPVPQTDRSKILPDATCLADDTWESGSLGGITNPPSARWGHTSVWTGSLMVTWGGYNVSGPFATSNTGGRYDPATDTWAPTSTTNAPSGRSHHTAVWTGSLMIVWGGEGEGGSSLITGGRYNPITDTWTPTSTTGAPPPPFELLERSAVWTGSLMVVWTSGRTDEFETCAIDCCPCTFPPSPVYAGGRYDPATDTWTPTSTTNAPSALYGYTTVWIGSHMVVWGGSDGLSFFSAGGRYDPASDTWTPTSTTNAPSGRSDHTAVGAGSLMLVWGGFGGSYLNTGGRYNPVTDTWTPISTTNAPPGRRYHTAVWTGGHMVVWGGFDGSSLLNTGGRYDPTTDTWIQTSTTNAPSARSGHTAVWTGSHMIVWGGYDRFSSLDTGGRYALGHAVDDDWDGLSECQGDCNDGNAAVHPGAAEVCNGLDDNCDGSVDEGGPSGGAACTVVGAFGACAAGVTSCAAGPLTCAQTVAPSAEVCDGVDNNCDGVVDNAAVPVGSPSLAMVLFGETAVLGWGALPEATGYDVVRGDVGILLGTGGDFASSIQGCLANDLGESALVLSGSPAKGAGFFYLVRGINCGGPGTYDSGDPAQVGSRDAEVDASTLSCP